MQASTAPSSESPFVSGARIADRYVVQGELGSGGMAAVYLAHDEAQHRTVALKRLQIAADPAHARMRRALFEREFHTLARLAHPRIIEVYDYGVFQGCPFYTMELLAGHDLEELAPLPFEHACKVLRDVASSLALLHAHRLVHRDVSPRNVRLTADGRAKLIDFGALTSFGATEELVGTPLCIAPESYHRTLLDQRTDLFALGAVAYWVLTKRMPYPARTLLDFPDAWRSPPLPPSVIVAGIPAELDALILSLLKADVAARPANVAVVIDRLTWIAKLPAEEDQQQAAESYLLSGRMVGRENERDWVRPKLERALNGAGCEILIEGPPGIGRSRLLRELCLDARLDALLPLTADAGALSGAYGVATSLAVQLLSVAPGVASQCAAELAPVLAQLAPELQDKLAVAAQPLDASPNERRALYRSALHTWFMRVAERLPLLLAVDNVHAADADSAAVLAGLAREAHSRRLIVLAASRNGDAITAPELLDALRRHGQVLRLEGLSGDACGALVRSLFGDVANSGRLARWLYERSAGNPAHCLDLARLIVRKNIARYAGGSWVLPLSVSEEELPSRADDVLQARLAELPPRARRLAEAMCIQDRPLALEACLGLEPGLAEPEVYAALDDLVAAHVLVAERNSYRFEQAALREATRRQLSPERRRELHARAAEALCSVGPLSPGLRAEAAWHRLRAGDETGGADMLAEAAFQLSRNERASDSIERAIEAFETALDVYERQGRTRYELAHLMMPLVPLAFYVDRRVSLKYCERALAIGLQVSGLRLAAGLATALPPRRALALALKLAALRFARRRGAGLGYELRDAIAWLCGIVPAAVSVPNICYDIAQVERMVQMLQPLRLFGPGHLGALMHDYAHVQLYMGQGREWEAHQALQRWEAEFRKPEVVASLGHARWNLMCGGMLFAKGILAAYTLGSDALACARAMEELGSRVWAMAADQVRLLYHALRGESERAAYYRGRVELFVVQGSSTWQVETFWPVLLLGADALLKDALATRNSWQQLTRLAADLPSLQPYADAAEAIYATMRGEPARAVAIYERILPQLEPRRRVGWSTLRAHFAEALIAAGEPERAKRLLTDLLAEVSEAERAIVGRFLEPERQLARAECALGETDAAKRRIDALLSELGSADQPLLIGLLHHAAAEIAIRRNDREALDHHLFEVESSFATTRNPALQAQLERLTEAARAAKLHDPVGADGWPATRTVDWPSAGTSDPCEAALRAILRESGATAGYLFVCEAQALRLSASSGPALPAPDWMGQLESFARSALEAPARVVATTMRRTQRSGPPSAGDAPSDEDEDIYGFETEVASSFRPAAASSAIQAVILTGSRDASADVVGVAVLELEDGSLSQLDPSWITSVARFLQSRH